jgi:hypothetical protein
MKCNEIILVIKKKINNIFETFEFLSVINRKEIINKNLMTNKTDYMASFILIQIKAIKNKKF